MSNLYAVSAQKPTAVSQAVVLAFTAPDARNLLLRCARAGDGGALTGCVAGRLCSKGARVELYESSQDGLVPALEIPLNGSIMALLPFRPRGEAQDLVFVLTDRCARRRACAGRVTTTHAAWRGAE
jgi:DNA damage-binding protein 1